jgi:hypothetical protein
VETDILGKTDSLKTTGTNITAHKAVKLQNDLAHKDHEAHRNCETNTEPILNLPKAAPQFQEAERTEAEFY